MEKKMLTIGEVAERLSVSVHTVRRLVWDQKIRAANVGRQYRFEGQWIAEFVDNNTKGNSDE